MNNPFNEEYYSSVNYTDYKERGRRYIQTAHNLIVALEAFSLMKKGVTRALDFGCAIGFLLEGFKEYGYEVHGYDISEWAVEQSLQKGLHIVRNLSAIYDIVFALDVLEHMDDEAVKSALTILNPKHIIVRIPCSEDGTGFHLEVSKRDPTHINCKTKEQWIETFKALGYETHLRLNLDTIYDSPGVFCALFIRKF